MSDLEIKLRLSVIQGQLFELAREMKMARPRIAKVIAHAARVLRLVNQHPQTQKSAAD